MAESNVSPREALLSSHREEEEAKKQEESLRVDGGDGLSGGLEFVESSGVSSEIASKNPEKKEKERFKSVLERGHRMARRAAFHGYQKSKHFIVHQYILFKQDARRGLKIIRWLSIISSLLLIPSIFFDMITMALTLSPIEFLSNIYVLLATILILLSEFACVSSRFSIRSILHIYLRCLELSAGRGLIQLFAASFCVSIRNTLNIFKFIPGLILLLCGLINLISGTYAACKLNAMLARFKDAETAVVDTPQNNIDNEDNTIEINKENNKNKQQNIQIDTEETSKYKKQRKSLVEQLDLIERKFEAIDRRGDSCLNIKDIKEAAEEMNLQLTEEEIDKVFKELDKDKDGIIDKDEFEKWWLSNKGVNLL